MYKKKKIISTVRSPFKDEKKNVLHFFLFSFNLEKFEKKCPHCKVNLIYY